MFSRSKRGFGDGSSSSVASFQSSNTDRTIPERERTYPTFPDLLRKKKKDKEQTPAPVLSPVLYEPGSSFPNKGTSVSGSTYSRYHQVPHERAPSVASGRTGTTMSSERNRGRRERTFVGSECTVCEEPLEHTLRGERILQFACSHVAHEACFYELIKEFESQYCPTCEAPLHLDTSRGGNVIDIEKISNMVRSASVTAETRPQAVPTSTTTTNWDQQTASPTRSTSIESNNRIATTISTTCTSATERDLRDPRNLRERDSSREMRDPRDGRDSGMRMRESSQSGGDRERERERERERYGSRTPHGHQRSDSEATGVASNGYAETTQSGGGGPGRRHDYDVQAMEATPGSPRVITRNPIPPPSVTVRSEFPTINRSRQQQSLTCLITVEVPDNKWRADPEDLGVPMGPLVSAPTPTPMPMTCRSDDFGRSPSPVHSAPRFYPYESREVLDEITENLRQRVDNWHGLDFCRFGRLRLYGTLRVGKDRVSWQELECYLFAEMLICVKEKKAVQQQQLAYDCQPDAASGLPKKTTRCTLKGSILIKKHLNEVSEIGQSQDELAHILTLSLSVVELPQFHLKFENRNQLKLWQQALLDLNAVEASPVRSPDYYERRGDYSETEEDDWANNGGNGAMGRQQRVSSVASSWGAGKSTTTAPTEYTQSRSPMSLPGMSLHVPIDVVVVVPISSSMQGVKINLVRDALRFMVSTLGERDRMGLVTFGSGGGGVPIVGMTTKAWHGWSNVLNSIKPVGQKSHRADVVEGANVAMDLLMQRKYNNPIATIMLISDASTSDADSVDFVVSRAEAAKITIHSFGLGMTHKPDTMIELSTRTKASYTYVKDWMMLRECLAGCLGSMQSLSHQNVKVKLKLPEGSPAKFYKINGALQITKRATGRDAEASLGDLRFGDKRDILVQLVIMPDSASQDPVLQDTWDTLVSGLEALGGPMDADSPRSVSVEEVPLIQADLMWGDILRDGTLANMPRPSLLAITMLPAHSGKKSWTPPIPPHPGIVQRRMELLTSDMLTRALTLVSRSHHDRAHTLLNETRSILKGLGKGGLPPVPPPQRATPPVPGTGGGTSPISMTPPRKRTPSPPMSTAGSTGYGTALGRSRSSDGLGAAGLGVGIDPTTVAALDAELEASLEWINHPAVFGRDSRKAVLQAIGVISSQRAFTFRSPIEGLWAGRVAGVRKLTERSREWREEGGGEGGIMEEA